MRLRDIATTLGVTEGSAFGIVAGLTAAGYVVNDKEAAGRGHGTHGNATDQSDQQHECELVRKPQLTTLIVYNLF